MKLIKYTNLIDIPTEYITSLEMKEQSALLYNEEEGHYIIPEGKENIYFWSKGNEPDIYFKADLKIAGHFFEVIGDTIQSDTTMVYYLENLRTEIINEVFSSKYEEICFKYKYLLKEILDPDYEGYQEFSLTESFKIFNSINSNSPLISVEDRQFIEFYQTKQGS
jgi:hypothetical protein